MKKKYLYLVSMDGYTDGMIDIEIGCYTRLTFNTPNNIDSFHITLHP